MKAESFLKKHALQFEQKSARERVLMLLAMAALLYFVLDSALITPQTKRIRQYVNQAQELQEQVSKTEEQVRQLSAQYARDRLVDRKVELDRQLKLIARADALLAEEDGRPLDLGRLLRAMIATTPGLSLASFKTLQVTPLSERAPPEGSKAKAAAEKLMPTTAPTAPAANGAAGTAPAEAPQTVLRTVQRHGVELSVKGNYLALLPYLEKVQAYPKTLFWYDARLDVAKYPDAVLRLTIYTLSEQPATPLK